MKKLVFANLQRLGSMKPVLLALLLSTMFMLDLSASQTDKNKFTFPHWKNLHRLNNEAQESDAHSAWFDIYINTLAKESYVKKSNLLPVGSVVVKPLYPDQERSETAKLTIMKKMEKGYDSENGDWWYGVYDEKGMEGYNRGKIQACIKCHKRAKDTDYMFSESIMESINEEEW